MKLTSRQRPSPPVVLALTSVSFFMVALDALVVTALPAIHHSIGAFPPSRRGAIVGIWGGIGGLAVAGGPLIGSAVVQGLSWHWIFWINVPIGIAAAALSAACLPGSCGPATRLADRIGARPLLAADLVLQVGGLAWIGEIATIGAVPPTDMGRHPE